MRRSRLLAAASLALVCLGAALTGCGSSSKTPTAPPSRTPPGSTNASTTASPMAHTGTAGTVGTPTAGTYKATNPTVLVHIEAALVRYFTAKGFAGVTADCRGVNAKTANCKVVGTNKASQTTSAMLTISVNQSTGLLRIVHVT